VGNLDIVPGLLQKASASRISEFGLRPAISSDLCLCFDGIVAALPREV
jgi:hypothetical protein